jgi:hypothetical protein
MAETDFSHLYSVEIGACVCPVSLWVDTGMSSLWVKWLEHEADHSPQCSVEVKNVLHALFVLMLWYLIEDMHNFTLYPLGILT